MIFKKSEEKNSKNLKKKNFNHFQKNENCHQNLSSKIVIKNCHKKLSSKIVTKNCHQKFSPKIVIKIVI